MAAVPAGFHRLLSDYTPHKFSMSRKILGVVALFLHIALVPVLNAQAGPMATPIQVRVNELGAATFNIPISVPPGTAGLQPNVAITYNSHQGNGLLGVGGGLSSTSTISRCPATKAQDDVIGRLSYDGDDRFCLDDQRLIAVSGAYGADGTEYRTEMSNFSKIVSYKSNAICRKNGSTTINENVSPQFFKVWTKTGQILEYGNTTDSNVLATNGCGQTVSQTWALNLVQDIKGNFQAFTYINDPAAGVFQPSRIDYTGNLVTGTGADNSVRFEYEIRPEVMSSFQAGNVTRYPYRLKNIHTYAGATQVRQYQISYTLSPQTARSRISTVTECEAVTGKCLPPTSFDWSVQPDGAIPSRWLTQYEDFSKLKFLPARLFANGSTGLLGIGPLYTDTGGMKTSLVYSTDSGYATSIWRNAMPCGPCPSGQSSATPLREGNTLSWLIGTVFGDGTDQLIRVGNLDGNLYLDYYDRNGNRYSPVNLNYKIPQPAFASFYVGDVDGDLRDDVIIISPDRIGSSVLVPLAASNVAIDVFRNAGRPALSYRNGASTPSGRFNGADKKFVADVNGDGRADVIIVRNDGGSATVDVYLSNDTGFIYSTWETRSGTFKPEQKWFVGDVNGDGLPDLINVYGVNGLAAIDTHINTGKAFRREQWVTGDQTYADDQKWFVGDLNGDGLADLLNVYGVGGQATVDARLSTGKGFRYTRWETNAGGYWEGQEWMLGDSKGQGNANLINIFDEQGRVSIDVHLANPVGDRVTGIANGLGAKTDIKYAPLGDLKVYPTLGTYSYPLHLVSSIETPNGVGGRSTTKFTYHNLRNDINGRGVQGFEKMNTVAVERGIKTEVIYGYNYPHNHMPLQVKVETTEGRKLSLITNTFSCWDENQKPICPNQSDYQKKFAFIRESKQEYWDLNGAVMSPTRTTSFTYDDFGNLLKSVDNAKDAAGNYRTTTENTYINDTTNWFIGRLSTSTVTKETP